MNFARPCWQQAIPGHGEEDARLTEQHHHHRAAETADSAELNQHAAPPNSGDIDADGYWIRHVKVRVLDQSSEYRSDSDVQNRTDR